MTSEIVGFKIIADQTEAFGATNVWCRTQCTFVSAEPFQQHSGETRHETMAALCAFAYDIKMDTASGSLTASGAHIFLHLIIIIVKLIIIHDFMELSLWWNVASLPTTSNAQHKTDGNSTRYMAGCRMELLSLSIIAHAIVWYCELNKCK